MQAWSSRDLCMFPQMLRKSERLREERPGKEGFSICINSAPGACAERCLSAPQYLYSPNTFSSHDERSCQDVILNSISPEP